MSERKYYSREAEEQAQRERFVLALIVAALGLGMGAVLALLFAPQSGDKTRQIISEEVERVTAQGRETARVVVNSPALYRQGVGGPQRGRRCLVATAVDAGTEVTRRAAPRRPRRGSP